MPVTNTTAEPHQALIDLAIQQGGSVETLFEVAQRNQLGITDDITSGTDYANPDVADVQVIKVFNDQLKPASAIINTVRQGGIDYMQISNDFKVS